MKNIYDILDMTDIKREISYLTDLIYRFDLKKAVQEHIRMFPVNENEAFGYYFENIMILELLDYFLTETSKVIFENSEEQEAFVDYFYCNALDDEYMTEFFLKVDLRKTTYEEAMYAFNFYYAEDFGEYLEL